MATKAEALASLAPDAEWVVTGDTIRWDSPDIAQPTDAEIDAEVARLTADEPWVALRAERDRLLAETDWVTLRAVDASNDGLGVMLAQVWVDYRQALRDLPANTTDPANPVWPAKPS